MLCRLCMAEGAKDDLGMNYIGLRASCLSMCAESNKMVDRLSKLL